MKLWRRLAVGASFKPVLWTLGLTLLIFVAFFNLLGDPVLRNLSGGYGMLGSQPVYTPAQALETLEAYGPRGREIFRLLLLVNLLFVPIYTLCLAGIAVRLGRLPLVNLLLALLTVDWAENAFLLALERQPAAWLAAGAGVLNLLKWVFLVWAVMGLILARATQRRAS